MTYNWEDIEAALQRVTDIVGHAPTANEYRDEQLPEEPTARTIINHIKRTESKEKFSRPWITTLIKAELDPDPERHAGFRYHKQEHYDGIMHVAGLLGEWPTGYQYRCEYQSRELAGIYPSLNRIRKQFGGWDDALTATKDAAPEWLSQLLESGPRVHAELHNTPDRSHPAGPQTLRTGIGDKAGYQSVYFLPGHERVAVVKKLVDEEHWGSNIHGRSKLKRRLNQALGDQWGESIHEVVECTKNTKS